MEREHTLAAVCDAVADLDADTLRRHAQPDVRCFAPLAELCDPGEPGPAGDHHLDALVAGLRGWADGPLTSRARAVDDGWALAELDREADGAPMTVVAVLGGDGRLADLRVYVDVEEA